MLTATLVTALIETFSLAPRPVHCTFPAARAHEAPIELRVTPRPSLKDRPGAYRVEFEIDGRLRLFGAAQPIPRTERRDAILRAVQNETRFYTLGIDDRGVAALNVLDTAETTVNSRDHTRSGRCQNYERYLDDWAGS